MRLKSILVSTTALLCLAGAAHAQQADPARLNEYTRVLASDEFEGRGVATPGHPELGVRSGNQLALFSTVEGRDGFAAERACA